MRLDDIFAITLDVARLVTRGSDAARIEAERIARQRGSRAATNALAVADQPLAAAERTPARPSRWLEAALLRR
jgi:hypothetical protein